MADMTSMVEETLSVSGVLLTKTYGRQSYEIEPWVFYGLEQLFSRDVGFAYSSGEECR